VTRAARGGNQAALEGEFRGQHEHAEVAAVLHGAPGLEAAMGHPVIHLPDPAEESESGLSQDEDIPKFHRWDG
jgi:hypothetical protein